MIKIFNTNELKVPAYYKSNLVVSGHVAEINFSSVLNHNVPIRKIDKNNYMYIKDTTNHAKGEILEYNHSSNRKENYKGILKAIHECSRLINCNFFGKPNELFITLTYEENMQNPKKLYNDLKNFIRNLRKYCKNQELLYIMTVEPQGRGAWHAHILLKNLSWTSSDQWRLENEFVAKKFWSGKGYVDVQALKNKNAIGNYITTYLTNLENGKKYSRLELYPVGINLYRYSRNCQKPNVIKNKNLSEVSEELKKQWNVEKIPYPTYINTSILSNEEDNFDIVSYKIIINLDYVKPKDRGKAFCVDDYVGEPITKDDIKRLKVIKDVKDRLGSDKFHCFA